MTEDRARLLSELLTEMVEQDGGFIPKAAYKAFHQAVSVPYTAVIIARRTNQWEVLLVKRGENEIYPNMWHIPGRKWEQPATDEQACKKTAREELGIDVTVLRKINWVKWNEHEVGKPTEFFFFVAPQEEIQETEKMRFFPISSLPDPMVPNHPEVLESFLYDLVSHEQEVVEALAR